MKNLFVKYLPTIIIFLLVVWAGRGLFKYEVNYTQDFRRHLGRSYDAVITLSEGSFPLRWAGILNYECGVPMYNFYNPLLYYLAAIGYFFTGHLLLSLKIINFLTLLVGTLFFFFWIKEETKDRWISFSASLVYLFAPYTFLLIYVRGSPEYLSYAILPIVLFLYSKAFRRVEYKDFVKFSFLAALAGGFLVISHNLAALLSLIVIVVYVFIKILLVKTAPKKVILPRRGMLSLFSLISIMGLGAFFIFPAILEKKFTKLDVPIFEYRDHFPTLKQVFNSKWGYGDSAIGTVDDGMSFQLGYAQWLVLLFAGVWMLGVILKIRDQKARTKIIKENLLIFAFFALSVGFLYLILPISLPIWDSLGILQTFQFSWRLLGICAFSIAVLFAFVAARIESKLLRSLVLVGVVLIAIVGNRNHLLPQPVYENDLPFYLNLDRTSDKRRFLNDFSDTVLAPSAKVSCYLSTPLAETNNQNLIKASEISRGSTHGRVILSLDNIKDDKIVLNLGYFPEIFNIKLNGNKVSYSDCFGRVCIDRLEFQKGENEVSWKVGQTKAEKIFNMLTLVFLGVWVFLLLKVRSKK